MDMIKAFLAWFDSHDGTMEIALEDAWRSACEWQKQKDAEICRNMDFYTFQHEDCATAILNQGK